MLLANRHPHFFPLMDLSYIPKVHNSGRSIKGFKVECPCIKLRGKFQFSQSKRPPFTALTNECPKERWGFLYKVPLLFKRRLQEERPFYFLGISKSTSMKTPKYGGRKKEENRNQNTENRAGAWSGLKKQNSLFLSCIYIVLCSCKLPKHYT